MQYKTFQRLVVAKHTSIYVLKKTYITFFERQQMQHVLRLIRIILCDLQRDIDNLLKVE